MCVTVFFWFHPTGTRVGFLFLCFSNFHNRSIAVRVDCVDTHARTHPHTHTHTGVGAWSCALLAHSFSPTFFQRFFDRTIAGNTSCAFWPLCALSSTLAICFSQTIVCRSNSAWPALCASIRAESCMVRIFSWSNLYHRWTPFTNDMPSLLVRWGMRRLFWLKNKEIILSHYEPVSRRLCRTRKKRKKILYTICLLNISARVTLWQTLGWQTKHFWFIMRDSKENPKTFCNPDQGRPRSPIDFERFWN